ncbi:MAG: hypothetical protein J0L99_07890 [Chitinophagales bacterium]|nr:hypothetical protein [Chitinophagales bacterium]
MSAQNTISVQRPQNHLQQFISAIRPKLDVLTTHYPGRTVFATQFTAEDQVLSHLIFNSKLPVRVISHATAAQNEILLRSIDFFNAVIELSFAQVRQSVSAWIGREPEHATRVLAEKPSVAPISLVLQGHHLLISSNRNSAGSWEWDESRQRAVYYPLQGWTEQQVSGYLAYYGIPYLNSEGKIVVATNVVSN